MQSYQVKSSSRLDDTIKLTSRFVVYGFVVPFTLPIFDEWIKQSKHYKLHTWSFWEDKPTVGAPASSLEGIMGFEDGFRLSAIIRTILFLISFNIIRVYMLDMFKIKLFASNLLKSLDKTTFGSLWGGLIHVFFDLIDHDWSIFHMRWLINVSMVWQKVTCFYYVS